MVMIMIDNNNDNKDVCATKAKGSPNQKKYVGKFTFLCIHTHASVLKFILKYANVYL